VPNNLKIFFWSFKFSSNFFNKQFGLTLTKEPSVLSQEFLSGFLAREEAGIIYQKFLEIPQK
jgi:hypothetical protein